ncbi:MAG: 4-hydroxythreonine-4-phosphate dehydrogenase PdxA [Alphaproteobacteria bacterium]|jgi:4-hydroxythreonine-4-phosphate dehydrogenase|nr:4-hydroxythreonine-4-phosphate dehydrogenase [Rhodospirillaceae bacterium]MDP6405740.1 4-hydroxythreonine-4-phosphate dehydrogenase PdxA [Alphaproteobacteria bacterium]MDP6623787.1 4-hydroxythreonine-4-phosphate dehydrogenase PdxA [Alphaproteobacteria bacterium]|tara:strand:+ start:50 stop:1006 length:957 start_codon:yes stop_codon:yes gene_type:complete
MSEPTLALLHGDRNGIGPEIMARLLAEGCQGAQLVCLGDPQVFAEGQAVAGCAVDIASLATLEALPAATTEPGQATSASGSEMLAALERAVELARSGRIDGIVFAPLNKQALHLGGLAHEDEGRLLAQLFGAERVGEINVLEELWTARVTSHVALKDVAGLIDTASILDTIVFIDEALKAAGVARPRLAVAALNPHAGDGGNFGREEIEVIAPAVERARARDIEASGPLPADTVFVRARSGQFDAVVTMFHDQGQIAMKLIGFERGVTLIGGLPVPVTTPAHGTAYDIVGQGRANPAALIEAFDLCRRMATASRESEA